MLVAYSLTQEGHVIAKKNQIHVLIFIISETKLNDIICFNLSGRNDAVMLTGASCCVYLLVKRDCQCVYEHLSLFTCSRDGECIVRLFLAAFTDGGVQQLAKFNVNQVTRKCISRFKAIWLRAALYKHLSCSDLLLRLFFSRWDETLVLDEDGDRLKSATGA